MALLERGTQFNLLLTDVMMPDVDGPTLLNYVRNNSFYQEMPVVMMSSNEHADTVMNCIRLGAEDYLLKPVTKKAVKHMWAHVWRRKQRYQMVPQFENGVEVLEDDYAANIGPHGLEDGHRLPGFDDYNDGGLPVPEGEEYSSDGEDDEQIERNRTAGAEYYEQITNEEWDQARHRAAAQYMEAGGDDHMDAAVGTSGRPADGAAGHGGGGCPFTGKKPKGPVTKRVGFQLTPDGACPFAGAKMEKVDEGDETHAKREEAERAARASTDPMVVTCPVTGAKRRLAAVPPIQGFEGLEHGARMSVRQWLDGQNAKGAIVDKRDSLHVIGKCAELLAKQHESGMMFGHMCPSRLVVSAQGDVALMPPTPPLSPRRDSDAAAAKGAGANTNNTTGGGAAKGSRRAARAATMRNRRASREHRSSDDSSDEISGESLDADDEDSDDDDGIDRAHTTKPSATGAGAVHTAPDESPCPNEFLYESPEERMARSVPDGNKIDFRVAECFGLGVLMVELCWPDVAAGAMGDVAKLLGATLRPDGSGAAALDADPNESSVARQLLQPVPGNRPSAKQVSELVRRAAEIAESEADAKGGADLLHRDNGWRTRREMGLATERRFTELITLRAFLLAHREARMKEVQGHRVRSALLSNALRQLGVQTDAGADDGLGERRGGSERSPLSRQQSFNRGTQSPLRGPSFDGGGGGGVQPHRRGTSLDIPRQNSFNNKLRQQSFNRGHAQQQTQQPAAGLPDHLSKLQPMKKRRQSLDVTEISQSQVPGDAPVTRGVVRQPSFTSQEGGVASGVCSPRTSVDGRASVDGGHRRSVERKRSFDGRGIQGGSPRSGTQGTPFNPVRRDASRTSMDTTSSGGGNEGGSARPRHSMRSASFNRSFSTGDLARLGLGGGADADAAAERAKLYRSAKDLDDAEFEALEENFFDACARAIAPVARNYAKSIATGGSPTSDGVPVPPADGAGPTAPQTVPSDKDAQRALADKHRQGVVAEAAINATNALGGALNAFGKDLAQSTRKTTLRTVADVSLGDVHSFSEMICSTGWDRDAEYIATAGISKRLRIFEIKPLINSGAAVHCPVAEMKTQSKLSSMVWNPYIKHAVATADYEGVLSLWDVNRGEISNVFHEHKKRVWSTSWSKLDPTKLVSGSDDGTCRVWSINQRESTAVIQNRANVCCVHFSPVNANVVAFGSADYSIKAYDLRHTLRPLVTLAGHNKAVSYVRWLSGDLIASASTDNTLKLWDVKRGILSAMSPSPGALALKDPASTLWCGDKGEGANPACLRTFTGHVNRKNFVGMSVSADGHIAVGSEDNSVCVYTKAVPKPVARQSLAVTAAFSNQGAGPVPPVAAAESDKPGLFVSSVTWAPVGGMLVAANSCGAVKIMEMTTPRA